MDRDRLLLAYLAGVMDSDGFISIRRQATNGRYPTCVTFNEFAGVGQTSSEAVRLFAERWGGRVHLRTRKTEGNWRPIHYWVVTNKRAAACIAELRPYLRVKARQADLLLSIRASKNLPTAQRRAVRSGVRATSLNPEVVAARTAAWEEIRSLNDRRRSNDAEAPTALQQ